jgi:predicted RecB family nuclease
MERRRANARDHRQNVVTTLRELHPHAVTPKTSAETTSLMVEGTELILFPKIPDDDIGQRSTSVHALIRVGKEDERFTYAPLLIKNHEVVENASTRRTLEGSLALLRPNEAQYHDGVGTRSAPPMTRSGLSLAHATRVLQTLGHADPNARAAVIDRGDRLWWFNLAGDSYPKFNLIAYDALYAPRLDVLIAHNEWKASKAPFPTVPYWHRDCPECPYSAHCEEELESRDDVSLVRFTSFDQQLLLREHGVETRAQLSRLDPLKARRSRRALLNPLEHHNREEYLGRAIERLDDLIYRSRAQERGSSLRIVDSDNMGCATADVEVDVDMESYEDITYLWGAFVTINQPTEGVQSGYVSFAVWDQLNRERNCVNQERSFAAYCFWAQAEDGAMNRAVSAPLEGGPTPADLVAFRSHRPALWIDLHEQAKRQIQTEGPIGLKQLAMAAGFRWRDANPSGEASILWYEESTRDQSDEALASRLRILEYNEDDCRATKALRDWLNGPARLLAHRDDLF